MTATPSSISAAQLRADGVSKSFSDRRVLTDISFTAAAGERIGLIGENGSGKTTLLRILAGALEPDAGSVSATLPGIGAARVGLLHQLVPFAPTDTVGAAVEGAVAPARAAIAAMERAAAELADSAGAGRAAADYADALAEADRLGAWETDARISGMLAGLSLGAVDLDRPTGTLSGGQRSRLALAWLLLSAPDVLVLDEPTNDLDDRAADYLRRHLEAFSGPVIFASHDRAFLDEAATSLLDLDPAPLPHAVAGPLNEDGPGSGITVTAFTGRYTDYLGARLDARDRWERQYRDEQAELKRLRASIRDSHVVGHGDFTPRTEVRAAQKFYADRNAKVVSRRVNDARSRYADLALLQVRKPPEDLAFRGLAAGGDVAGGGGHALAATRLRVAGRLAPVTVELARGDKLLVTGENGSGKSTLLAALAGELTPSGGTIWRAPRLRAGLLAQTAGLPDVAGRGPNRTVREAYEDLTGAHRAVPLGAFGLIAGRDENRPVASLSAGQQRRLALAVVLADPPDILLLDEPTNHVSLLLATELEAAIGAYPGTVVIASHDRWLRRRWRGRRLELVAA